MSDLETLDPWLSELIRARMSGSEERSVAVVTAVTTLLAQVAYADGHFADGERARVRDELSLVLGFGDDDVEAVCDALDADIARLAALSITPSTDVLRKHFDMHMRADAVKVLVELAASDRDVSPGEMNGIHSVAEQLEVPRALVEALFTRAQEMGREHSSDGSQEDPKR